ncbi:MlaD family protein [Mycobacteroides franklinii]|uniref:MlaD family protein n=1 Tax=Mycobacteroides franklinii TaxID=948102 RepID=UPI00106517B3|nr:MlaD family protein [Mycobacteroides franklinii]TDZ57736.1 mce related protein [Mycobacteroides franklinii]
MINAVANAVVGAVRAGHRRKSALSTVALALTLVLAVTYLCVGALRANPFASTYQVTVKLSESGGLLPRQDVALRGVKIGTVRSLQITPRGVEATAEILSKYKIPAAAKVRVTGLSAAGEQYLNFEGKPGQQGPYLQDGSVIAEGVQVPVTLAKLLADADGLLAQVDPKNKLTEIIDGGTFLLSTLDSVLPETTSLLKTSRVVLTLAADKSAGIKATADSLGRTLRGVEKMQNGYRTLIDQTPKTLSAVDNLFNDNSDTIVQLLASLASTSQMLYVRTPAINAFFPNYRGSTFGAIADTMRDNGIWVTADLYPRYACDYGTPRVPPSSADFPEPPVHTYCADDDPAVLIRGAKNAPRPAGDDTAGPPAGADLGKTTDPTPKGRFTIPTPPGGPTLPIEPPR